MVMRDKVITYATDVPTSNRICNLAWDRGHIVLHNFVNDVDAMLVEVAREEAGAVYMDGIYEVCKPLRKGVEILSEIKRHNVKVITPDWELDPMYNSFDAAIDVLRDLAKEDTRKRSEAIKIGQRYSKNKYGRVAGRPRKRMPMMEVAKLRAQGLSWSRISKELDIPKTTLIDRREDVQRYIEDWKL